ncbi:hypothetical protein ACI8AV_17970 [Geodermatophilus sp. SYSU D00804]
MARINKAAVVHEATNVGRRISFVAEDPAVIKAAKQAAKDVAQAARSCATLGGELKASWDRSA